MADPEPTVPAPPFAPEPPPSPSKQGRRLLGLAAGFYVVVALFAAGYAVFSRTAGALLGERAPGTPNLTAAALVGIGIVVLCHVGDRLLPSVRRAGESLGELLGPVGYGQALLLAALSGCAEELLFRGALWPHLGLWGTSLLFGLVHVLPRRSLLLYPVFAAAVGVLMGLLRDGSGSVVPPMIAHALVNGANLVWIERRRRARPPVAGAP